MNAPLHRQLLSLAPLDVAAAGTLLAAARSLQRRGGLPLLGKNIALMCGNATGDADAGCNAFSAAAMRLGARVARIEAVQPDATGARLIEHLYDAVDCEALPLGFAQALQGRLAVPVFDGLARDDHPMLALLDGTIDRCALMQAALVSTLL